MAPKKIYTRRTFVAGLGSALAMSAAPRILAQTSPCAVGSYYAQYYRGTNFEQLAKSHCEAAPLNKDWGAGSISPLRRTDNASVRWTGYFQFQAGEHEFAATADDGIRVYVNGVLIIDEWRDQSETTYKARHTLSAGTHEVKVEYYERSGLAVCKLSWALLAPNLPTLPSHPAKNADRFVDTIGVNTHISYLDSPTYGDFARLKARLQELGVRHIRDAGNVLPNEPGWNDAVFSRHKELADLGIKTNYIMYLRASNLPMTPQKMATFAQWAERSVLTIEGPNEYNTSGSANWAEELRNFQRELYQSVKGNPSTANVPVLAPAMENHWDQVGDLSAYCDYGNHHMYPGGRDPESPGGMGAEAGAQDGEYGSYTSQKNLALLVAPGKPQVTTETGYHNQFEPFTGHPAVPEDVSAIYLPRLYAYYFLRSSVSTQIYELANAYQSTPINYNDDFGLLRHDWTEKPAFSALKNFIGLLKDPGNQSFTPGTLSYELAGNLADVKTLLLQKASGRFYLLVWLATRIYDPFNRVYEPETPRSLTLNLGGPKGVNVYEPNSSTGTIATHSGASSVPLSVTEKMRVVEIA
jgi:PA14 domain